MATFQIHQDAEKENPQHMAVIKEKSMAAAVKTNILQPSALSVAAIAAQKQIRSNLTVLSSNANAIAANKLRPSKVAFREVHNVQGNDENAIQAATVTAAITKSTVVPVVEQFKSFSVYEDQSNAAVVQQSLQSRQQHVVTNSTSIVAGKENVHIEQQQRVQIDAKRSETLHKEFGGINEYEYGLDATPMSVSDVLSPMSVDRSQIVQSSEADTEKLQQQLKQSVPRNDRQRFFEVPEYQRNILEYFRESEKKHRPKPHYMRRQSDINYSMRTILVDWLVEVSEEYNLDTETLYLSVSYIDRFLSQMSVVRSKLQLVGTAAMYISSKYEEIYPPDVGEFVFITDDTYNKAQVLRMEQIILKILAFDLCTPTAYVFINTYSVLLDDMTETLKFLTQYICELSLLDADPYLRFHPSLISAASLALARRLLDISIWSCECEDVTSYRLEDLKEVFLYLCKSHSAATTLAQQAIQEKYKAEKYKQVSTMNPIEMTEEIFDEVARKYNERENLSSSAGTEQATTKTSNENVRRMISLMFN